MSLSLLLIFSRFEFFISLIFLLIFYIFLLGRVLSSPESSNNFKYLFKIIFNEGISFLLPILSRLTMSLDRMMISLFYPSNLWQITVLSQYFFAFVFIYDLFNLGPQKYKILKKAKDFRGTSIKKIIFNGMKKNFIFFLISLTLFLPILFSLFSSMFIKIEIIYVLSLLIFLTSFLYAFSEKLHEVLCPRESWYLTFKFKKFYVIFSDEKLIKLKKIKKYSEIGIKVKNNFEYNSYNNPHYLTVNEIKKMNNTLNDTI